MLAARRGHADAFRSLLSVGARVQARPVGAAVSAAFAGTQAPLFWLVASVNRRDDKTELGKSGTPSNKVCCPVCSVQCLAGVHHRLFGSLASLTFDP